MRPSVLLLATAALTALAACGSSASPARGAGDTKTFAEGSAATGSPLEKFFPLVDGNQFTYATARDDGDRGMLLVHAHRIDATHGELRTPGGRTRRFAYMAEGIGLEERSVYVLKEPLTVGNTWTGEHGGRCRIAAIDVTVDVPAGRFVGCVETLEERLGDAPIRYRTTFCPDVGVTVLDVESGAQHERAELRSFGPPVDLGADGVSHAPP